MSGHKYKLTYFNSRGRAELARLIFAAAGQKYEDNRIEKDQLPELKPKTPFGQVPILEVDGSTTLCQGNVIARYLADEFGLAGKTNLDKARAHMIIDCLDDTLKPATKFWYEKDETKKAELKKAFIEVELPKFLALFEKLLKENKGGDGFIVGDSLTWADLGLLNLTSLLKIAGSESSLDGFEKLSALIKRVAAVPKVAEWLEKRPVTAS